MINVQNKNEGAFMAALRFTSWLLVAIALMMLGADSVSSMEGGSVVIRSIADYFALWGGEANGVSSAPGGMGQALGAALSVPAWAVFGVLGVILVLIFRPMD